MPPLLSSYAADYSKLKFCQTKSIQRIPFIFIHIFRCQFCQETSVASRSFTFDAFRRVTAFQHQPWLASVNDLHAPTGMVAHAVHGQVQGNHQGDRVGSKGPERDDKPSTSCHNPSKVTLQLGLVGLVFEAYLSFVISFVLSIPR